jgi:porin
MTFLRPGLLLVAVAGTAAAQDLGAPYPNAYLMPGTVEADLAPPEPEPPGVGPVFPDFVLPGRAGFERWRDDLDARANLRFEFNYQQLYQYATETVPGAAFDTANGGWAALEAIWTPLNRGTDTEGRLVVRLGWRGAIGDHAVPAQFGLLDLGTSWSNYEFTSWDGGVKVEDLFWEQRLGPDFSFRIGNVIPTAVYNFSRFKDARVSFTASPFAFHEMIPQPTFGFGGSFRWTPPVGDREVYVVGTINDMNGEPAANGLDWSTVEEGQFFYGLEVGKRWRRANGEFDHLHLNVFYADERSTRLPDVLPNEAGWGFRLYGEKQVGRYVGFGGYTYNTAEGGGISATVQRHTGTLGMALLDPFGISGEAAVGGMWVQPFDDIFPGSGQRDQYGLESYWRIQLTPNMTITPGFQLIKDPSFNPEVDTVFIPHLKFRVTF